MTLTLVDSNVLIDQATPDDPWYAWSARMLRQVGDVSRLVINPLIYAEVSLGFSGPVELDALLPEDVYLREDLPWEAAFEAGRSFLEYRRRGGARTSPLPDFYIGAHAMARGYDLLTRDARRYRTYFPTVRLISPSDA
jgi:hypothetical protein